MRSQILITLPDYNVTAKATLLSETAPKTVKAIKALLPINEKALHARWGGDEIWLPVKDIKCDLENHTIMPSPGDLLLVNHNGLYDIAIFYGKGWTFSPSGFLPGNHFATIDHENLKDFATAANKILSQGAKDIKVELIK